MRALKPFCKRAFSINVWIVTVIVGGPQINEYLYGALGPKHKVVKGYFCKVDS